MSLRKLFNGRTYKISRFVSRVSLAVVMTFAGGQWMTTMARAAEPVVETQDLDEQSAGEADSPATEESNSGGTPEEVIPEESDEAAPAAEEGAPAEEASPEAAPEATPEAEQAEEAPAADAPAEEAPAADAPAEEAPAAPEGQAAPQEGADQGAPAGDGEQCQAGGKLKALVPQLAQLVINKIAEKQALKNGGNPPVLAQLAALKQNPQGLVSQLQKLKTIKPVQVTAPKQTLVKPATLAKPSTLVNLKVLQKVVSKKDQVQLNPQPLPPKASPLLKVIKKGQAVQLNPQPLPPKDLAKVINSKVLVKKPSPAAAPLKLNLPLKLFKK